MESKKLTWTLFIIYAVMLVWVILFKMGFSIENLGYIRNINLIPFSQPAIVNDTMDVSEIIDNMVVFVPFGIFMGMFNSHRPWSRQLVPIFLTSLLLEIFQFILAIGASDITDLITNTLGGAAGIGIFRVFSAIFKDRACKIVNALSLVMAVGLMLLVGMLIIVNI